MVLEVFKVTRSDRKIHDKKAMAMNEEEMQGKRDENYEL